MFDVDEASDAGFQGAVGEHGGGGFGIGGKAARFGEDEAVVLEGVDFFDALGGAVPGEIALFADAVGEEVDEPFGLNGDEGADEWERFVFAVFGVEGEEELFAGWIGGEFGGASAGEQKLAAAADASDAIGKAGEERLQEGFVVVGLSFGCAGQARELGESLAKARIAGRMIDSVEEVVGAEA